MPCLVLLLRWCVIIYVHGILDTLALETRRALPNPAPRAPQEVRWFSPLKSSLHSASPWRKCGFRCWTQRSKWSHQKYVRSMTYAITQIVIDFFPSVHAWCLKRILMDIFHENTSSSTIRNWIPQRCYRHQSIVRIPFKGINDLEPPSFDHGTYFGMTHDCDDILLWLTWLYIYIWLVINYMMIIYDYREN